MNEILSARQATHYQSSGATESAAAGAEKFSRSKKSSKGVPVFTLSISDNYKNSRPPKSSVPRTQPWNRDDSVLGPRRASA